MAKKIFKRSLALGALMAFVITGNVWAANITNQTEADKINENTTNCILDGAITSIGTDVVVSGNENITVLTVNGGDVAYYKANGTQEGVVNIGIGGDMRDTQGKQITVNNIKVLNINATGRGMSAGSDASNIGLPKGKIYIDDTVATTDIKAHHGVISGGEDALVQIESKKVNIEAGLSLTDSYGLGTVAGGEIQLGTEKNKIETLSITGNLDSGARSFAVRSSNTNSNIHVLADDVHLKSNHTTIRSNGGKVYFGTADNMVRSIVAETYGNGIAGNAVVDFSSGNGLVEFYADKVSLINHEEGQNAISVGNTGTLKIVAKENIYIKGNITSFASTPIIDINTGNNDALVKIEGNISLNTNAAGINNGATKITLGAAGSYLKGKVTDAKGGITLTMNEGTSWEVKDNSNLKELAGKGGSLVLATIKNDSNNELDVANIDVGVNNNANLTVLGDEVLTQAIEDGKLTAEEALETLNTAVKSENKESKAITGVKTAEGKILGSYVLNNEGKAELQESSKSAAISEAGMNLKAHWRAHMNDMNKRMGELRFANGETGVWTRMIRGESEYEGAKMQYNQYQLGYDEKLSVDKRWTVGAAVTFAEGDSSYGQGSSEDKSTAFAIYGSKLNNDGTFVDLIARYARLESDIEDSVYKNGEYNTNGMSVSAEFGKRIQQGKGFWIEPQVELTYGTVDSETVRFADGSVANYGDMDSLIGRVGFSIGKDIKQGNVYARASYLYDFEGETETTFTNGKVNGKPVEEDFGGGWWEVGVGANINLSKATYVYADVEKTFGGEVDTNWQWNLGVRYSF